MSPKTAFYIIITQVCSNGWWYCKTHQYTLKETPLPLIPAIATACIIACIIRWMIDEWDE